MVKADFFFFFFLPNELSVIVNAKIKLIAFFAAKDGEALYNQQKQDGEQNTVQIMSSLWQNSGLN